MNKPQYLLIEANFAQQLVNYLELKPHREVRGFIDAIMRLQPAPEPQAKANGAPKDESHENGVDLQAS